MSLFRPFLLPLLCAAALARAQDATSTPPPASSPPTHTHTPPPSPHDAGQGSAGVSSREGVTPPSGVVVLDQFVTSASPLARNQADLAQATTVLSGQTLLLKQQATLGDTLMSETGIHATSFGPGASRPIIRGLGGDRIRLLENSVGTIDASVLSPDHAVSVEPLLVERIEIVRGPASLLYGSNAVGGVVNVITHRIETDLPTAPFRGRLELRGGTAADELAGGGAVDLAVKPAADRAIVLHLDGFRRTTENLRIPGFAESAALRAEETAHAAEKGEAAPSFAFGRLPNSALESTSGAIGLSYVTPTFHFGVSHSGLDSEYGVPGHEHAAPGTVAVAEGVRIDLRQRRTDLQGEWHGGEGFLRGARLKFGDADYQHAEQEPDGTIGTVFTNQGFEGRLELLHGATKAWTGALGAQVSRSDFGAVGDEAFLPPSRTDSAAVFAFEEVATGRLAWQFGGRFERTKLAVPGLSPRQDDEIAASVGAVWKLDATHTFTVSLARTGRPPNAQELYANGPHAGTQSFEIGDAQLGAERSVGLEASVRRRRGLVTGAFTVFAHRFHGYLFEQPTGQVAVGEPGAWEFVAPGSAAADAHDGGLPVYRQVQRDAQFWGAELETIWHVHESKKSNLDVRLAGDFTRAQSEGRNLPRIPAARTTAGLTWSRGPWNAGAECQVLFQQNRVAPNETPSDAYTLVSAYVSRRFEFGATELEVFARGTNLTNAEARPHPSFVKDLAPLGGRGVTAGVRLAF